jgi:hypothetical protein
MKNQVKVTSSFETLVKLKQGDVLPTVFFNLGTEKYEGHLESKERFAIKKYLLIIGKK